MVNILEEEYQLDELKYINRCFLKIIPYNDFYHPVLNDISLIYIYSLDSNKEYIISINHSEALSINLNLIFDILNNIKEIFVLNKKEVLHYNILNNTDKLYDIQFINLDFNYKKFNNFFHNYFNKYKELNNINCLIPIYKHYEECNFVLKQVKSIILDNNNYLNNKEYIINNNLITNSFFKIEREGLYVEKSSFKNYINLKGINPCFNLKKSKIYTQYNLYTTTGRPSNIFNKINFGALNKTNGERSFIIPKNDKLIEMDINGYHPRILADIVNFDIPYEVNIYDYLSSFLNISNIKELVFSQIYGGITSEYIDLPFFKEINNYVLNLKGYISSNIRNIKIDDNQPFKTLSHIIQGLETYYNSIIINDIINYTLNKKSKLILYTYDAFLFDVSNEDENFITDIKNIIKYPVKTKQGNNYNNMKI